MRISYAIILATAAVSFEGCKVEKAAGVTNEGKDKKKVAQLDEKNRLDGGDGAGLGPDGEGGDEEDVDDEDAQNNGATPAEDAKAKALAAAKKDVADKAEALTDAQAAVATNTADIATKEAELAAAQVALQAARQALAPARQAVGDTRGALIHAVVQGRIPKTRHQVFREAVESIQAGNRDSALVQQVQGTLAGIADDQLPQDLRARKGALVAALAAEEGMPAAKTAAKTALVRAIKAEAPVQFEVPVAALQAAVALRDGGGGVDVDAQQAALLLHFAAADPAGAQADIAALYAARNTLRERLAALPDMAALGQTLRERMVAHLGDCPAGVGGAWPAVRDNPDADLVAFSAIIDGDAHDGNANYGLVRDAAAAITAANAAAPGLQAQIVADRTALLDRIIPAPAPVPIAIVIATKNLEAAAAAAGDIEGTLGALLQAIDAAAAGLGDAHAVTVARAAFTAEIARINGLPAATDRAKGACVLLFDQLTRDPVYDAIDVYNGGNGLEGDALVQAQQTLIAAIPQDRRQPVAQLYTAYTAAMEEVRGQQDTLAARTQAVEPINADLVRLRAATAGLQAAEASATTAKTAADKKLEKLTKPPTTSANANHA